MANGNGEKCKVLVTLPRKLRSNFKEWCYENDMSMNSGICTMMKTVTSKKKFKLQKRILEMKSQ